MRLTRQESRAVTRAKLIKSARYEFCIVGYCAASIEEIAQKADFTRGAFYANFADKADLMMAVIEECKSVDDFPEGLILPIAEWWRTAMVRWEIKNRLNAYPHRKMLVALVRAAIL